MKKKHWKHWRSFSTFTTTEKRRNIWFWKISKHVWQIVNGEQERKKALSENVTILNTICLKKAFYIIGFVGRTWHLHWTACGPSLGNYGSRTERKNSSKEIKQAALDANQTMRFSAPEESTFDDDKIYVQFFGIKGTDLTDEIAMQMDGRTQISKILKKYVLMRKCVKRWADGWPQFDDYQWWVNDEQNPHGGKRHEGNGHSKIYCKAHRKTPLPERAFRQPSNVEADRYEGLKFPGEVTMNWSRN